MAFATFRKPLDGDAARRENGVARIAREGNKHMAINFLGFTISKAGAAGLVKSLALSEAEKAVSVLKSSEIGAAVVKDIEAASSKTLTGREKFELVVTNAIPLVTRYAMRGGYRGALADAEDIARQLVQAVYNDAKSSTAGKVAAAILAFIGRK